jgi:hypothetical protein
MVSSDYNSDGYPDLFVAGNMYNAEVETTRNDAGYGKLLYGDGQGKFKAVPYSESGIYIPYDTKEIKSLKGKNKIFVIAANNNDKMRIFQWSTHTPGKTLAGK